MSTVQTPPNPAAAPLMTKLPTKSLKPSPTNPRKHFDKVQLEQLTESVKKRGLLTAILVRPLSKGAHEIVAGERRWRAATAAGLDEVDVQIRDISDAEVIELQVTENLERADLHPLEEAEAYFNLTRPSIGYDVARVAERVGRSIGYVRDRLKLLSLINEAQELFRAGKIAAGHAVILSRLSPKDQERAMDAADGGLWENEQLHLTTEQEDALGDDMVKPKTARELQSWVDEHVKLDVEHPELPELFPAVADAISHAEVVSEKVVHITHDHRVHPDAKGEGGQRIYSPNSWRRADKPCAFSITGVIVIGPGRGEAFKVCVDNKECTTHFGEEIRARKKIAQADAKGDKAGADKARETEMDKYRKQREREDAARKAWDAAGKPLKDAIAAAVKKAPTSLLGAILLAEVDNGQARPAAAYIPEGRTAEDILRHLALRVLLVVIDDDYAGPRDLPKLVKALGVDVGKILSASVVHELHPAAKAKAGKKSAKRK